MVTRRIVCDAAKQKSSEKYKKNLQGSRRELGKTEFVGFSSAWRPVPAGSQTSPLRPVRWPWGSSRTIRSPGTGSYCESALPPLIGWRLESNAVSQWHGDVLSLDVCSCSGLVIAMVVSLVFIFLLRYLAGVMVWVIIVLVVLVIGYGESALSERPAPGSDSSLNNGRAPLWCFLGIYHCYMEFASLTGEPGANVTIRDLGLQTDFSVYLQIRQTWLAFSENDHGTAAVSAERSAAHPLTSFFCSDHPGCGGGRGHPAARLPQEEDPDRHRSHQRGQQVSPAPQVCLSETIRGNAKKSNAGRDFRDKSS